MYHIAQFFILLFTSSIALQAQIDSLTPLIELKGIHLKKTYLPKWEGYLPIFTTIRNTLYAPQSRRSMFPPNASSLYQVIEKESHLTITNHYAQIELIPPPEKEVFYMDYPIPEKIFWDKVRRIKFSSLFLVIFWENEKNYYRSVKFRLSKLFAETEEIIIELSKLGKRFNFSVRVDKILIRKSQS